MTTVLIISLLKYLVAALIVAYFTSVFMKRKEVKLDVEVMKLEKQLQANVRLHKKLMGIEHHIAPAQETEAYYNEFIERLPYKIDPTLNSYPKCFDTIEKLEEFHDELLHEKRKDEPFLDYKTVNTLDDILCWLEDIDDILTRFVKFESDCKWNYSEETQKQNSNLAIRIFGLALQNDINNFEKNLSHLFQKKLHKPRLSVWKQMGLRDRIHKTISSKCEKEKDGNNWQSRITSWIYYNILFPLYGRSQFILHSKDGNNVLLLMFVHYSPQMEPNDYFDLPREKQLSLLTDFHTTLVKYFK